MGVMRVWMFYWSKHESCCNRNRHSEYLIGREFKELVRANQMSTFLLLFEPIIASCDQRGYMWCVQCEWGWCLCMILRLNFWLFIISFPDHIYISSTITPTSSLHRLSIFTAYAPSLCLHLYVHTNTNSHAHRRLLRPWPGHQGRARLVH